MVVVVAVMRKLSRGSTRSRNGSKQKSSSFFTTLTMARVHRPCVRFFEHFFPKTTERLKAGFLLAKSASFCEKANVFFDLLAKSEILRKLIDKLKFLQMATTS